MLTLLCTAPNSSVGSPIEGTNANTFSFSRVPHPPPLSGGAYSSFAASAAAGPSSSPTTPTRKLSLRRPSIRKRIQSLSRASGASLDKATSTLSNAASKSAFSFFRHASQGSNPSSGSSSLSSSAGNTSASMSGSTSGPTTGSGSAHTRGASTSSFASGKSNKSASGSSGHGGRLNILNISAPSAFKHQFHLGTNTQTSDGSWDEMRWRQVIEMRETDEDDTLVIDVVPPTASSAVAELSRESSSSERNVSFSHTHSRSHSRTEQPSASLSSPNLLQIATSVSTANTSSSSASPASANTSTPTPSSSTDTRSDGSTDKTKRQAKRASLVKRKPVPPLYPEEMEPMPTTTSNPARSSIPAQAKYVLMPDPAPGQSHLVPETAPAGKTSFEAREPEVSREVAQKETLAKLERAATVKEKSRKESTSTPTTMPALTQSPVQNAPEHICILHSAAPAPKPPPRRHTLAHMQARALGRGMCDAPSLPSVPASEVKPTTSQEKEKERKKKSRARPVPIVAPSPAPEIVDVETPVVVTSATSPILPPGLPAVTGTGEEGDESPKEVQEEGSTTKKSEALPTIVDNSPRPSLSSLASSSEGSETARSASSSSSSSSGDLELDLEPRTPTDEKRVSAGSGSASSIKRLTATRKNRSVRIVVSGGRLGEDSGDDEYEDGVDAETPRTLRRASKRPNPPLRRLEANEESVYVTADEAEDM
ncbi:hypothetical protein ACEPAF_8599 [Sanghuangporus sanghuang]